MKKFLFNKWSAIGINIASLLLLIALYSTTAVIVYAIFVVVYNEQKDRFHNGKV